MDENTTYEVEATNENEDSIEVKKDRSTGKKVLFGGLVLGAVGTAIWYKTKKKREALTIKRLEKKGYMIVKPATDENDSDYVESDDK